MLKILITSLNRDKYDLKLPLSATFSMGQIDFFILLHGNTDRNFQNLQI